MHGNELRKKFKWVLNNSRLDSSNSEMDLAIGDLRHVNKQPVSVRMCNYKLLKIGLFSTGLHKTSGHVI
jgi:hypothetical protein